MITNYDLEFQKIIENLNDKKPSLLLHSCCGPCSSAVIERLIPYFDITIFYYNPNIEPFEEYMHRKEEQIRYIKEIKETVKFLDCDYENERYESIIKGLENEAEGGLRCLECFKLRLNKTALEAKNNNIEYFGTTLTVSPHKNSQIINQIGATIAKNYGIKFLYSDFKKKEGYKRSLELSKEHNLYRQDYCGCLYSKNN